MDVIDNLNALKRSDSYRSRLVVSPADAPYINIDGKQYINFCSNDYLGLSQHKSVIEAYCKAAEKYGVGAGSSQLISGYQKEHEALENSFANYLGFEKAVLFGSGYLANLGIQQALFDNKTMVYLDKLNHASIYDALKLSAVNYKRFPHLDSQAIIKFKKEHESLNKYIISDAVFSMDGHIVDLSALFSVGDEMSANIILDDAHGFGVMGKTGKGSLEFFGNNYKPYLYLVTFGKALGSYGAVVCGDKDVIELLIQKSRSLIYTTSLPPSIASATHKALSIIKEDSSYKEKLDNIIAYFINKVRDYNLPIETSLSPIQIMRVGSNEKTLALSRALKKQGLLVVAIRPPTVLKNTARLRITLTAMHTKDHVDVLLTTLCKFLDS